MSEGEEECVTVKIEIDRQHCLEKDRLGCVFFPKHWGQRVQDLNAHLVLH